MEFGVWLPVYGGWLRVKHDRRRPHFALCRDVALSAERLGFSYLYASENYLNCVYGPQHEVADAWVYLSAIAATTNRIGLVGGMKPGFLPPFVQAQMVTTLDWVSKGRISLNVVCGWWRQEFEHCGVEMLDHDHRYLRATEYVHCLKGLWTHRPFTFLGKYYDLQNVEFAGQLLSRTVPSFWVSGHSKDAIALAAKEGDVLFVNGGEPVQVQELAYEAKKAAASYGRKLQVAANAFVLLEDTDHAAEQRYEQIVAIRDSGLIGNFRSAMDESGAAVWMDLSETQMVDSNAGFNAGLVGSRNTVVRRLAELEAAGVDILMCQFDDTEKELPKFSELVLPAFLSGTPNEAVESCSM
jgi:dimethylsulfone monooxygenase